MTSNATKPKAPILRIVISAIIFVIVLCLFISAVTLTISPSVPTKLFGYNFTSMDDNSMGKSVEKGSLCIYKPVTDVNNLVSGDLIVFRRTISGTDEVIVRQFKEIKPDVTGVNRIIVMNHLDQEESYSINAADIDGKINKTIPVLGSIYSILINKYVMFLMCALLLIIILQPILYAPIDMSRIISRQQAKYVIKEQKRIDKLKSSAEKDGTSRLVFYDYKYNPITKTNLFPPRNSMVGASSVEKARDFIPKKSKAVRNVMIILMILAVIALMSILFLESTNLNMVTYDYQMEDIDKLPADSDNQLKKIKPDALIVCDDVHLRKASVGDIIILRVEKNGIEGVSARFLSRIDEANGKVVYYTYGVKDADGKFTEDNRVFYDSEVVGLYNTHNNVMGKIYSFLTSVWMFALFVIFFLFILLVLVYYKISNRMIYMPTLTDKAKRLLARSERIVTVRSVSVASKRRSFVGLLVFMLTIVVIAGTGVGLGYGFKVGFKEITSSLSSNPTGSYTLMYNKANIRVGDKVVHTDKITAGTESVEVLSIKYVVDINGDSYILGIAPGVADYVGNGTETEKLSVSRDKIVGRELFTINKFNNVLIKLKSMELIIVYIVLGLLVFGTIIGSSIYGYHENKKLGLIQNVLGNTFVELNNNEVEKYLRKAKFSRNLPFCEENSRVAYNLIKNFMLSYKKVSVKDNAIYEQYYCNGRHVLSLEINEGKLYAYTNLDVEKFKFYFNEISTISIRKFKEPKNRIGVVDSTYATEFIKLIESQLQSLHMQKYVKPRVYNYSNSYDNNAIIMTKTIVSDKSGIVK